MGARFFEQLLIVTGQFNQESVRQGPNWIEDLGILYLWDMLGNIGSLKLAMIVWLVNIGKFIYVLLKLTQVMP
jgi:hypothetical protein